MNLFSPEFLVFLVVQHVVWCLLPGPRKRLGILAGSLFFLWRLMPDPGDWLVLGGFLTLTWIALQIPRRLFWGWIGVVVALFVYLKKYTFLNLFLPWEVFDHPWAVAGLSYMLFKWIHVLVDRREGSITRVPWSDYVAYQLTLFTVMAGPIQRFKDFQSWWTDQSPQTTEIHRGWMRILFGLFKMGVLGAGAHVIYREGLDFMDRGHQPWISFWKIFYGYPAYIYFNFSGYCDIMIGAASMFGLRLPENFKRPYLARNMNDFWNRWHITLSMFIRDYLFMSTYKYVATRSSRMASWMSLPLLFLSLTIMGAWHGSTLNYLVFGILHGFGVVATQVYSGALKARLGRAGIKKYMSSRWIECCAMLVTFHFACATFLVFPNGLRETVALARKFLDVV